MNETGYVQAFDLMWEFFPESTVLVHKDRTVIAANASARRWGRREGAKCFEAAGGGTHCRGCQADRALQDGSAKIAFSTDLGAPVTSYWLPLPGSTDLYVHFGIGIADILDNQASGTAANDEG